MNIFEKATRAKLRFTSGKGEASIEDLWDLTLTQLDQIGKAVIKKLKEETEESLIESKSRGAAELELKLELIKHVIAVKQDENKKARERAEKKSQVEFMKGLLEKKKMAALEGLTVEEIEAQINAVEESD